MILRASMYSFSCIIISLVFVSICVLPCGATVQWQDCGAPLDTEVPRFTVFDLFPNPVVVGQTAHVYAKVTLPSIVQDSITDGSITMEISFNDNPVFTISNIYLCNSSSAIVCSALESGPNPISFNFEVPQIPEGDYEIKLSFTPISSQVTTGCLQFSAQVVDLSAGNTYTSWIAASLLGAAQFATSTYTSREIGETVQVGPIGPASSSSSYQWGTFASVDGSEDLIQSAFDTTGYVWGLSGSMVKLVTSQTSNIQTYSGTFYVGYVGDLSQQTLDTTIATGTFSITWTFIANSGSAVSSNLTGNFNFSELAVLPTGWSAPVSLGRLGTYSLYTTSQGNLMAQATSTYCISELGCTYSAVVAPPGGSSRLSNRDIALAVVFTAGIAVLGLLLALAFLYWRHRRSFVKEANLFSSTRRPEYGNALVIDDIIQESRDHAEGNQGSRDSSFYSVSDDEEAPRDKRGRSSRNSNSRHSRSLSRSASDESDGDKSPLTPSRRNRIKRPSRSKSRSPSPSSLSRTPRSPRSPSSRSISRSRTPPRTSVKGKGKLRESDYSSADDSYKAKDKSGGEYSDATAESR